MHTRRTAAVMLLGMVIFGIAYAAPVWTAEEAPRILKEEVKSLLGDPGVIILDARIGAAWEGSDKKIKGAVRVDPAHVGSWAKNLPKNKMIVVYCS